ncbi:MAG: hypothetical protein WEB06_09385 [Actinomycetota bacterium]
MRRPIRLGILGSLAITMLFASVAYGGPVKKLYTVDISAAAAPVTAGQAETFDVTITNKAVTQQLGSCNLTLPDSLTGISATNPQVGTATVVGSVIQLRDLATPPLGSRTFTFTATAPTPGTYTSAVDCRQANNYSADQPSNKFTLDAANSTLSFTAVSSLPSADLQIVTAGATPDPEVFGGNTVQYILVVTNNGPSASGTTVTVNDSVTGAGAITFIAGDGWTCSGSGASASCTGGQLASGDSRSIEVRVQADVVSSETSLTNTAGVTQSGEANDPASGNNTTSKTTAVKPGGSNGSGFISNVSGGTVMTEPSATALNRFVGSVTFPGQEGATGGGFLYSMHQDSDTCGLLPCNFAMFIDVIPAAYDNPQTEGVRVVLRCDATVCPGTSTAIQMFVRDETGQQKLVFGCTIAGIVDPVPCVEIVRRLSGGANHGDLEVTMLFLAGDPKIAGIQFGS